MVRDLTISDMSAQWFPGDTMYKIIKTIFAFDRGTPKQSSFCTVTVRVVDVNDNTPQFVYPTQKNHTIYASAYTPPGIPLVKLTAVDPDQGDNARLSFHLDGDPAHARIFHLDEKSGELSLLGVSDPAESVGLYQLKLRVTDSGTPPLSGHANINIVLNKNAHAFSKYSFNPQMLDKTADGAFMEGDLSETGQVVQANRSGAADLLLHGDGIGTRGRGQTGYYHPQSLDASPGSDGADNWNNGAGHALSYFSSERALIIIICLIAISAVIAFLFLVAIVIVRRKAVALNAPSRLETACPVPRIVNACAPSPWFGTNKSGSTPSASFASNKAWLISTGDKSYSPAAQSTVDYVQRGSCSPLGEASGAEMLELDKRQEQTNYQFCNEILVKTLESNRYTPSRMEISSLQRTPCVLLPANDLSPHVGMHRIDDHLNYKCAAADSTGSSPAAPGDLTFHAAYQTIDEREWVKRRGLDQSSPARVETHMLMPRVKFAEIDPAYQDLQFATVRDPPGPLELSALRSVSVVPSGTSPQLSKTLQQQQHHQQQQQKQQQQQQALTEEA
ncbi:unnamed protein product [Echinostoma caproni]|uniref:CA domain-containing protein n=1 Tax=Echinostoma caproni TaxID=27848 RepID=A0A183AA82_9TREM|nr:unnamed protein product [Echinostoma caproni]